MYDYIGIGLGPANLSLAALLKKAPTNNGLFLEQKPEFRWHPHMLFSFSKINVGYHKDLVSLVDPTNPYSFLNYLVKNQKQYEFFNADFDRVSRIEFENYYQWVANALTNIKYNQCVQKISYDSDQDVFNIICDKQVYSTTKVIVGVGLKPLFPSWFNRQMECNQLFHSYDYLKNQDHLSADSILIIGGGQSSAEVIYALLEDEGKVPSRIFWVSTKGYPVALDENPLANEIYTPSYSRFFYGLKQEQKESLNVILKDTSDGIHSGLLQKIYQRLYQLRVIDKHPVKLSFMPMTKVTNITKQNLFTREYQACLEGLINKKIEGIDAVIFCTGYDLNCNGMLSTIKDYYGDQIKVNIDFSLVPQNKDTRCKLFLNNGAKAFFGPADPNLSLKAWRSAIIINSMFNQSLYDIATVENLICWGDSLDTKLTCNLQEVK